MLRLIWFPGTVFELCHMVVFQPHGDLRQKQENTGRFLYLYLDFIFTLYSWHIHQ